MHFWSVWHEGRDFEHYRDVRPRFCSEFGFQSYTSMPVIRSFAAEADLNIASPVMESHQKNAGGNARIAETMFRYFRFPEGLRELRLALARCSRAWRSRPPSTTGAASSRTAWARSTGSSTTPGRSPRWSSLDYGGGWKLLHHMARRFFAPVNVVAIPEADGFRARRRSTTPPSRSTVTAAFHAVAMDGTTRPLAEAEARVGTDAAQPLAAHRPGALAPGRVPRLPLERVERRDRRRRRRRGPTTRRSTCATPGLAVSSVVEAGQRARPRRPPRRWRSSSPSRPTGPAASPTTPLTLFPGRDAEIAFTPADGDPAAVTLDRPRPPFQPQPDLREPSMTDFSYQLYSSRNFPPLADTLRMLSAARLHRRRRLRRALRRRGQGRGAERQPRRQRPEDADRPLRARHAGERARPRARDRQGARHRDDLLPVPRRPTSAPTAPRATSTFGQRLQEAGKPLRDAGLGFGWHNHAFEFEKPADGADPAGRRSSRAAPTSNGRPTSPG